MSVDRIGIADVLAGYDMYEECPYFALFEYNRGAVKALKFAYKGEDRGTGKKLLNDNLQVLLNTGYEPVYLLRFYESLDNKGNITDKTEYSGSFTFRVKSDALPMTSTLGPQGGGSEFTQFLLAERNRLMKQVDDLEEELADKEQYILELEAEPAPEPNPEGGVVGMLKDPTFRQDFKGMVQDVTYAIEKIFNRGKRHMEDTATHLAGVDENATPDERENAARQALILYYINKNGGDKAKGILEYIGDLELLAQLTRDPVDFDYAIAKMRQNFKK